MKEEYLLIEELCDDLPPSEQSPQYACPTEFPPLQPSDFNSQSDDAMLKKLLKKFQMCFLYPFLKACDITYRSLRYLSVEDINTAIRSVGHRAEFREKLFNWRRKRYRTNDVVVEHEKVTPLNTTTDGECTDPATYITNSALQQRPSNAVSFNSTQTAAASRERPSTSTGNNSSTNTFQNAAVTPVRSSSISLDAALQEMSNELSVDMDYEIEAKRPKLYQGTIALRETRLSLQLNLVELLEESLFGPVLKAFYEKNGFLERKHRDELIQCIVDYVIKHDIKLHSSDFDKIVDMITCLYPTEEESRDYYFINRKGKRNPMGRLYTKYYNTLKRIRVRDIHQEYTHESTLLPCDDATSACTTQITTIKSLANVAATSSPTPGKSNNRNNNSLNNIDGSCDNSNSVNTQIEVVQDEFQELVQLDDTSASAIKNFLRCQGLDWDDVKTMWAKTYLARQEDVEHSTIKDVLQQWPKYLSARGMELFDIDFRLKFSRNKANALQQKWQKFAQKIFTYYQGNIKDDICKGLFALCKSKPGKDTEDYILTVLLNAIMLPMTRYRDAVGNRRKISIVEAVDLFAIRVTTLEDLDQKREEFSIKYGDIHTDHTPLIVVVGDTNINIHEIYVHFDVALYEMPDFISALDCCMKIYRVLNLPYPPSNEYSWTFIQRYFYEIVLADDIKCPSMSSLITYLKF